MDDLKQFFIAGRSSKFIIITANFLLRCVYFCALIFLSEKRSKTKTICSIAISSLCFISSMIGIYKMKRNYLLIQIVDEVAELLFLAEVAKLEVNSLEIEFNYSSDTIALLDCAVYFSIIIYIARGVFCIKFLIFMYMDFTNSVVNSNPANNDNHLSRNSDFTAESNTSPVANEISIWTEDDKRTTNIDRHLNSNYENKQKERKRKGSEKINITESTHSHLCGNSDFRSFPSHVSATVGSTLDAHSDVWTDDISSSSTFISTAYLDMPNRIQCLHTYTNTQKSHS